ncbi:MAG: hypothetical protein M3Y35_06800 [Actinomycetota bacterium]|nr:hypothetical protein [Actinomycetota bacterium]
MDVELLVIADCPNGTRAAALLCSALRNLGLGRVEITTTVITSPEHAERRGFTGSPTILIDGNDPFPEPDQPSALACRVYPTSSGPGGIPDLRMLREALKRAVDPNVRNLRI